MGDEKIKQLADNVRQLMKNYENQVQLYRELADQCLYALEGKQTPQKKQRLIAALRALTGKDNEPTTV